MKQVTLHKGWTIKTDGKNFYAFKGKLKVVHGHGRLSDLLFELSGPRSLREHPTSSSDILPALYVKPQAPAEPLSSLSLLASIAFIVGGVLYSYLQKSKR